jgi:acetyl-CoA carboxylase biotin carboxyl carrier protein
MNFNEIQELIKLINKSNLTEFKLKDKDFEVLIRTENIRKDRDKRTFQRLQQTMSVMPQQQAAIAPSNAPAATAPEKDDVVIFCSETAKGKNIVEIKSPIVGTFYRSSGPDKPVFTKGR